MHTPGHTHGQAMANLLPSQRKSTSEIISTSTMKLKDLHGTLLLMSKIKLFPQGPCDLSSHRHCPQPGIHQREGYRWCRWCSRTRIWASGCISGIILSLGVLAWKEVSLPNPRLPTSWPPRWGPCCWLPDTGTTAI